jgi:4-coumarate--CoA ligase
VLLTFLPNSIDTPAVTFGTLWTGGVVSPANPAYTAAELSHQLKDSGAKALITQNSLLEVALEAAKMAKIPADRVIVVGDEKSLDATHFLDFNAKGQRTKFSQRVRSAHLDVALLVYSSGTTGLAKGVILSNRNLIANALNNDVGMAEASSSGKVIGAIPFYHIYGNNINP